MKLFSGSSNSPLAEKIAHALNISVSPVEIFIFPDGERRVMLEERVVDDDVILVQSTGTPADTNYMELFFLTDALRRSGARSITAVIPYLGYERQDHVFRSGESRSLEVVIRAMENAGADRFVVIDLHTIKTVELFIKPVVHLSALPLFAKKIQEEGIIEDNNTVLVSPDMGGVRRAGILAEMLNLPTASIEKNRDLETGSISAQTVHGAVKKHAIILDDMIASGSTIVQAVGIARARGAKKIWVFATHAVFSQNAGALLEKVDVEKIYLTDTLFLPEEKRSGNLEVLSVADIIAEELKKN